MFSHGHVYDQYVGKFATYFCFDGLPKTRLSQEKIVSNWSKCFLPPTRARSIIDSDNCTKEDKVARARNWSDGTFVIAGKTIDKVQFLLRGTKKGESVWIMYFMSQ